MADASSSLIKEVLLVAGGFITAIAGAIATIKVAGKKEKVDVQATLNAGFAGLIDQLQEQVKEASATIKAQGLEIEKLRGEVRQSHQRVESLERFIKRNNLDVPTNGYSGSPMSF